MEQTIGNYNMSVQDAKLQNLMNKKNNATKSNNCNQFEYAFSEPGKLRIHLKIHSGEKSNKCNQCNYASSQAGNLRTHLKIHNNEMRGLWFHILVCKLLYNYMNLQPTLLFSLHWEDFCLTFFVLLGCLLHLGWSLLPATSYSPVTTPAISTFIALLTGNFLDAIASPSTYPSRWVGGSVGWGGFDQIDSSSFSSTPTFLFVAPL